MELIVLAAAVLHVNHLLLLFCMQENMPNAREYLQHNVVDRLTGAAFLQLPLEDEVQFPPYQNGAFNSGNEQCRSYRSEDEADYGEPRHEQNGYADTGDSGENDAAYADDDDDAARAVQEALADAQMLPLLFPIPA